MHLLVVEHNPERTRAISSALGEAGHRVEAVTSGSGALAALARPAPPDLVLLEDRLPDMSALEFLRMAVRMAVPLNVVVLGLEPEAGRWVDATRLGVIDYVTVDEQGAYLTTLAARLDVARDRVGEQDRSARLADALESTSAAVLLVDRAGRVEYANAACARLLGRTNADLLRLDIAALFHLEDQPRLKADLFAAVDVGGEWAGEVAVVRQDGERVPCIVNLSPVRRTGGRIQGLVLTLRDVTDRVAIEDALRAANRRLSEQAARDHLTGLYNRGYLWEVLEREIARTVRYGDPLSVIMSDLDDFKAVNDAYGHGVGDVVLQQVARVLPDPVREGDVVSRYGGDEFCILLPNADDEAAAVVAERLRRHVEEKPLGPRSKVRLTLSIGLATSTDAGDLNDLPAQALLRMADEALLEAKRQGGNRVVAYRDLAT